MKTAVISDSHDNVSNLAKAIEIANQHHCQYLFHLGDIISPFTAGLLAHFHGNCLAVFGNCDGDKIGLQKAFNTLGGDIFKPPYKMEINGKKIVLMHEPVLLEELMTHSQLDFIFYGHLHKNDLRQKKYTLVLNPGEVAGIIQAPSFYVVDILTYQTERIDLQK